MKIENYIKSLSKKEKMRLVQFPGKLADIFQGISINCISILNSIKKEPP
jgi:hypothetical protein